jgi:hypothetical protein
MGQHHSCLSARVGIECWEFEFFLKFELEISFDMYRSFFTGCPRGHGLPGQIFVMAPLIPLKKNNMTIPKETDKRF